ncbi:MAG: sulfur carrier protein ThiS [Chromatiales bacterium]|nr:sulfur carrier protein ThiS [Chromatiales bacterium]
MISIMLNDETISLKQGATVDLLLEQVAQTRGDRLAVAVNNTVISRSDWPKHQLYDHDQVLIIAPIQGG